MTAPAVLVVEDEPDLAELVCHHLEHAGLETIACASAGQALQLAAKHHPQLVLLDVMLPDANGFEVCRQLRAHPATRQLPVIMLTALGDEAQRVAGLEAGADDYVCKPFSVRELMLRVKAVLRRHPAEPEPTRKLRLHGIELDLDANTAEVSGKPLKLAALEFRLLAAFLQQPGITLGRSRLLEEVWEMHPDLQTRTVDTHVKRLREHLGAAGDCIETVRGFGYRMAPERV